jgi:DNA-binding MarR family transcriptional regulator
MATAYIKWVAIVGVGGESQLQAPLVDLNEPGLVGWRSFLEAYFRIMRILETELAAERGLGLPEYVALFHLYTAADQLMRMSDLADLAFLSRSGMTRVIDRLERGGYVVRKPSPGDQRRKLAALTPKGQELLREAFPVHHRGLEIHVMSRLSNKEWETLCALMDRLG